MKSAIDLSNANLACMQIAGAMPISYQPVISQPVLVTAAPAPSTGESFFVSVIDGALGGVIGNAINGGNHVVEIHHHTKKGKNNGTKVVMAMAAKSPANICRLQPARCISIRRSAPLH